MTGAPGSTAEKVAQFYNRISGVEGVIKAKRDQLAFVEQELGR